MSYIVMALRGRLGNHLWQYASGLGMARELDAELRFDARRVPEPIRLLPQLLGDRYREASPGELRRVGVGSSAPGVKAAVGRHLLVRADPVRRRAIRKRPARQIRYGDDAYGDWRLELDLPAYLAGHFQDERFFATAADDVASAIRWPGHTTPLPSGLGATVAVSFRRGDFNLFGAGVPLEYYDRAMALVADTVERPTFVLFGDDPVFVELFAERAEHRGWSVVSGLAFGPDPLTQLRLISECDHAVLSNSTFAWWGAWLGDRRGPPERVVIAPAGCGPFRAGWTPVEELPGVVMRYDLTTFGPSAALA